MKEYAGKLDTRAQESLGTIVESASEMSRMTEDILAYSHTATSALELETVSLQHVVSHAMNQLRAEFEQRNVQLVIVEPLPGVRGHPTLLGQVIVNLLTNAVKYVAPNVRPQIKVWSERCQTSPPTIRLWVEDNGIDIAPGDQERIFRLFERGQARDEYPGTGVGLAIVRKGVERMGGQVGLESTLGVGSRFWIELPDGQDST